jgi:predicted nucleic acid-binding protein
LYTVVDMKLRPLGLQDASELEELLKLFSGGYHTVFTSKTKKIRVVEKDPDDDKFIECAAALNARYIITGDKALRDIGDYMGIKNINSKGISRIAGPWGQHSKINILTY